ncbi:hypothetical protein [Pseudomonas fluorescens]|uniref:hypothetical protein n=1 Tax=Pseudomonas fluorescens TaxID=294 RepID=UPI001784121E|nr:hypothetical protein [Pseudomonas fluorescens]
MNRTIFQVGVAGVFHTMAPCAEHAPAQLLNQAAISPNLKVLFRVSLSENYLGRFWGISDFLDGMDITHVVSKNAVAPLYQGGFYRCVNHFGSGMKQRSFIPVGHWLAHTNFIF